MKNFSGEFKIIMATEELRKRANWQTSTVSKALKVEVIFQQSLQSYLSKNFPEQFIVKRHPKEFKDIYSTYNLPQDVLDKIYNINVNEIKSNGKAKYQWGISMDFAIRNLKNGKTLFGEIKRQDGWVETTSMQAGRGNAHERCCKYFAPGILQLLREKSNISDEILPFWIIFAGDITRDPRRNREIAFWFQNYTKNFYMWYDVNETGEMINFFRSNLLPYLL